MRTAQIGPDLRLALTGIIGGQGKRGGGGGGGSPLVRLNDQTFYPP